MNQPDDGQGPMAAKNFSNTPFSQLTEIKTGDVILAGCRETPRIAAIATVGDWDRGSSSISRYGCGACDTIPGIAGAHGLAGPPLAGFGNRVYIAGMLQNQPAN